MKLLNPKYLIATLAIFSFLSIQKVKAQVSKQDSLVLVDFYNSTNGANWKDNTNWLTTEPLNTWKGIVLDTSNRVSEISLYVNNLTGTLPNSIGNLTHLTSISLHINAIGGDIPASIGKLTNLTTLDLGENSFTGKIPDSLATLTKLTQLDLDGNLLIGSIPSWIGNFTSLQYLWLQYNNLSDTIPSSIGNLAGLQYLVLQNNKLSGAIPASFSKLNNLQGLFLQNNKFTFAGMELIATKFPFAEYAPQAPIPLFKAMIPEGGPVGLSVEVGGTSVKNNYYWYNDSGLIASANQYYYEASNSGYYYVRVTDSLVPGLELHSDTIKVDVVVPIKSISLQAKEANGKVLLQWNTINEINTASFTIQHSRNGVTFTDVSSKSALGKGDNNYSLMDELPYSGINYYRIKIIDKDGAVSYSKVVSVQLTIDNYQLLITPNPSKDKIIIKGSRISSVQILDNAGRVLKTYTLKDATNPTLSVGSLPAGVYHLRVQTTDGKVSGVGFVKE